MKRMSACIIFAAVFMISVLFDSCSMFGLDVKKEKKQTYPEEVTVSTFETVSPEDAKSEETTAEPVLSDEKFVTEVPEIIEPPMTAEEDPNTDVEEPNTDVEEPIIEEDPPFFTFLDDFYVRLDEIFERYSINRNCQPDQKPCGCVPEFEEVDEEGNIITPRDRVMSLYFMDIESGYEFMLNENVHYPVASTVKIPFCIYIYEKIEAGEIDPEMIMTYEKRHYFKGTGVIVKGEFGQQFSVIELLTLAITESDNVAYEMLKDLVTWEGFSEYLFEKGMSHERDTRSSFEKICSESAGVDGKILSEYLRGNGEFVESFKANLLKTKNRMIRSHYPFYRKYGWTAFAFHDIAYVEAPHPYIIAILSNIEGEERADYSLFADVSYLIEEYSQIDREELLRIIEEKEAADSENGEDESANVTETEE